MALPNPSFGWNRRVVRPRAQSAPGGVFIARKRPGRRRVFYDLPFNKGQLANDRVAGFLAEYENKRGSAARFTWTPPDGRPATTAAIVTDDMVLGTPKTRQAVTLITVEVFD